LRVKKSDVGNTEGQPLATYQHQKNKKWSIDHGNTTTRIPGTTSATIAGFFRDDSNAENAIEELRAAGFSDREIGVATPHQEGKVGKFWNKLM